MDNITMENMKPKMLAILMLSLGCTTALLGCSQSDRDAETIASEQDAERVLDYQNSRNTGSWGGVYMSRDELAEPQTNIVNDRSLPKMEEDPSLTLWEAKFEGTNAFVTTDGAKLYHDSCAGCHMHEGEGAQGAGYYPPLANNSKMESKFYTIDILINGFRGMPSFHMMMDDEQMAAVTQYVMNDLNDYNETVTAADVAQLRHAQPPGYDPSE